MSRTLPIRKRKIPARQNPEMEKLKDLWMNHLNDVDRAQWQSLFTSNQTQKAVREKLLADLKVNLVEDYQLGRFRAWVDDYEARFTEQQRMVEDQEHLQREFPNWTLDKVRGEVLKRAYGRALANGNLDFGLKTVRTHTTVDNFQLNEKKFHFDAAEMMQKIYPQVRVIQKNDRLTDREKINEIRRKLFGMLPEDAKPK